MNGEALASRTLTGYLWASRGRLWGGLGLALLRSLAVAPCPWLFQRMIDVAVPARDSVAIATLAGIFVLLLGVHYVFSVWGSNEIAKAMARMMVELRSRIFFKLQFLSFGYLDQHKTGRLLSKYAFDTQKVEALLYNILNQFLPNILYGASIFLILAVLNWQLALVLVLVLPAYGVAKYHFFARIQSTNHDARLAQEKLTGAAGEYISALRLVRSFGEEKQAEADLDRTSMDFARSRVHQSYVNAVFGTFWYVSTQVISLVVMAGGALLAIHGLLSYGTLFAFVAGLPIVLGPIQAFVGLSEQYFTGRESYLSIKELVDSAYVEEWHGTRRTQRIEGDLRFEQVAFAYPTAPERRVLHPFNLHIRPGEHVAFVGPSGSGKSTLANLLLGLYAPGEGRICIDGVPQSEWDMRWIRRQLAVVLQDSLLLSGSIRENLRFARAEATDEEIREAARQANAEEFILRLPQGYDTQVGERGTTLSGGQRQRLAIARAILRNPPVLILDEATSALDYESERLIQEALDRLSAGRTVITIAHRLSTIRNARRILVLHEGRLVEEGDFRSLLARNGHFARLVAAQKSDADLIDGSP
ncbi:MAG TPA: ABC transporter ATP-binding protein [Opitutaceae bacterium]|nr:ABC transporter ATP-binding protein [Opitutaceae bacterium]HRE06365.1 ABC transporter ATP-binding protein [Opitutaceae bacterium]